MNGDFYNRAARVEGLALAIHEMAGRPEAAGRVRHVVEGIVGVDRSLAEDLLQLCTGRALSDPDWSEASRLVELAIEQLDKARVSAAAG
jgi:hypothetical protein